MSKIMAADLAFIWGDELVGKKISYRGSKSTVTSVRPQGDPDVAIIVEHRGRSIEVPETQYLEVDIAL